MRIAIPLSKLRVAPDGSHATLHSLANAHPLKVVTGKRNLLVLDFGDAQQQTRCVGNVRHGSIKRVASAVGEGAIAVEFIHRYMAKV